MTPKKVGFNFLLYTLCAWNCALNIHITSKHKITINSNKNIANSSDNNAKEINAPKRTQEIIFSKTELTKITAFILFRVALKHGPKK